MFLLYYDLT